MTIFDRHPGTLWTINACLGIVAALLIVSRTEQNTP
jgi:hypothetical protein